MKRRISIWEKFYVLLCFAFFYLPILVTVIFSFNSSKSLSKFTGFSLRWYGALINNTEVVQALYVSLSIALISTLISTVLGTMTAIGLSRSGRKLRDALLSMNDIPILNPDIVTAISWMLLFSSLGLTKGYLTMLLAHIGFSTPFVITSVYPKVRQLDPNLANAAMDLGATPFQALTGVIIPMIRPGIFAGILLAFTMSFDDFVISYFVTGGGVKNISIVVYNMTKRVNPIINALSTIVIVVIVLVLMAVYLPPRISRSRGTVPVAGENGSILPKKAVAGRFLTPGRAAAILCILALVVTFSLRGKLTGPAEKGESGPRQLRVYNAGEYIDLPLLDIFQEEYDCKVIYETFESNEMMYTKLQAGDSYDILVPSDYMIERLIREDYLQEIDWSLITNKDALDPRVMGRDFDPSNSYHVPYFWGSVGILYNKNVVDEEDLEQGWDLLMNEKYKGNLYMYDSERDSFMVALKALGYSMNTDDEGEIYEAYNWLVQQRRRMLPIYAGDDVIDNMASGNKAIAVVYSGDGALIMSENEDMKFFEPEQGTNIWTDGMVITKDCRNTELAHEFIDFMLREDVAYQNTRYIGYSSPVKKVFERMQSEDYAGIEAYIPRSGYEKDEVFAYQELAVKELFAQLWTKVKAE